MSNVMAILQDVDRCMRCNGCVISCKRTWKMKAETIGVHKVSYDQRVAIKSQKRVDMGPFIRFSCWHCPDPPCAGGCPFKAIKKEANGAVSVDQTLCKPDQCRKNGRYPCQTNCQRGGYPKIGVGSDLFGGPKMQKCTLCFGKAGEDDPTKAMLPTKATSAQITAVPEKAHQPACVYTCPAVAMKWDTRDNILAYLNDPANGFILPNGTKNWVGNGSMFWASRKVLLAPPKADPLVEDHLIPASSTLSSLSLGIVPALALGGMLMYSKRRAALDSEPVLEGGEE